ncbi:hypothetical protein A2U04_05260 [Fusobacterium necrophorum subsp. funduliforme]|uniref:hypothetical protein n=1 Tax=Fusobacterium necrophorum TaxID=859 RepID=UPI000788476C|nr:hypothetical protein [Fusobacterium necrophorum]KYM48135.1 hypothetical protein A2U04_05260 [Fusobacterium necrophorum subsp. funduliforme]
MFEGLNIITSFNDLKVGENYLKIGILECNISIKMGSLKVTMLKSRQVFSFDVDFLPNDAILDSFVHDVRTYKLDDEHNNFDNFIRYLLTAQYQYKAEKVFNPFFKKREGTLKVKKITKTTLKKILKHGDTVVTVKNRYSDDYYRDYINNYDKNVIVQNEKFLKEIDEYPIKIVDFDERKKTIFLFMNGYSEEYEVKNKNIILL